MSAPLSYPPQRLASLDAYRGFVMLLMMAGLTLNANLVTKTIKDSAIWTFIAWQQHHVDWRGCSLHDLIQPSFSFIVGVALPFSIAARMSRGQSMGRLTLHAAWRSLLLIFLGVFLRSVGKPQTLFTFTDTLAQIGFGYTFLFMLGFRGMRTAWVVFTLLLLGDWLLFALWPLPGPDFAYAKVGAPADWFELNGLHGFEAHWNINSHPAWAFDVWFLNLFPREARFEFNPGGTSTLNFIPTLATMILGLITGKVLQGEKTPWQKAGWLVLEGLTMLGLGWGLELLGVCPLVKKLWTPSWVLFSGGWCLLLMTLFYVVMDIWQRRAWAFPLLVIGLNSIAAYCMVHLMDGFIRSSLLTHLGKRPFQAFGPAYENYLIGGTSLLVLWLILLWMYRRKLFLKI